MLLQYTSKKDPNKLSMVIYTINKIKKNYILKKKFYETYIYSFLYLLIISHQLGEIEIYACCSFGSTHGESALKFSFILNPSLELKYPSLFCKLLTLLNELLLITGSELDSFSLWGLFYSILKVKNNLVAT